MPSIRVQPSTPLVQRDIYHKFIPLIVYYSCGLRVSWRLRAAAWRVAHRTHHAYMAWLVGGRTSCASLARVASLQRRRLLRRARLSYGILYTHERRPRLREYARDLSVRDSDPYPIQLPRDPPARVPGGRLGGGYLRQGILLVSFGPFIFSTSFAKTVGSGGGLSLPERVTHVLGCWGYATTTDLCARRFKRSIREL